MQCSCSIDSCSDTDVYDEPEVKIVKAVSDSFECGECGKQIKFGEQYEWYRGEYDGKHHTHHTCLDCLSLKENFFSNYAFKGLWEDFNQHMDDCEWQVPEDCLAKVTPATRAIICENIEREWGYLDDQEGRGV